MRTASPDGGLLSASSIIGYISYRHILINGMVLEQAV